MASGWKWKTSRSSASTWSLAADSRSWISTQIVPARSSTASAIRSTGQSLVDRPSGIAVNHADHRPRPMMVRCVGVRSEGAGHRGVSATVLVGLSSFFSCFAFS